MERNIIDNGYLKKLGQVIYELTGNHYPEERLLILAKKINAYLEKNNNQDAKLKIDEFLKTKTVFKDILDLITVPETKFFRELPQLETFEKYIVPTLKPPINVASYACATGEEPYTIAMILEHSNVSNYKIYGFDINETYLEKAKTGIYLKKALMDIPEDYKKFIHIYKDHIEIDPNIKKKVEFKPLNLIREEDFVSMREKFDVAFCRNALIYFDNNSKAKAIKNIAYTLKKDGYFIVSMTEVISSIHTTMFETIKINNVFFYKKK